MKNGKGNGKGNLSQAYAFYKKDILALFEESMKDTKSDISEMKTALLKNTSNIAKNTKNIAKNTKNIAEMKQLLTNHFKHDHQEINKKLDKILKQISAQK